MAAPNDRNAICDGFRPTKMQDVLFTSGGKTYTWMDRNLGASRAATTYDDYLSYGCFYQWGRGSDGHASVTLSSSTTGTPVNGMTTNLLPTDIPSDNLFIYRSINCSAYGSNPQSDWSTTANDNLWQGVSGIDKPYHNGFRLPTAAEFTSEVNSGRVVINGSLTFTKFAAFSTVLKLPTQGNRYANTTTQTYNNGTIFGRYWTSTISTFAGQSRMLQFGVNSGFIDNMSRSWGMAVRCIKD